MNSSVEDIYNWFKKYLPSKLIEEDFDIDELFKIYECGENKLVGRWKDGDIISYDWKRSTENTLHTAVLIFKSHIIDQYQKDITDNYDFFFFSYIGSFDLYSEDNPNIMRGSKVVYQSDIREASLKEKLKFFDNLRRYK